MYTQTQINMQMIDVVVYVHANVSIEIWIVNVTGHHTNLSSINVLYEPEILSLVLTCNALLLWKQEGQRCFQSKGVQQYQQMMKPLRGYMISNKYQITFGAP